MKYNQLNFTPQLIQNLSQHKFQDTTNVLSYYQYMPQFIINTSLEEKSTK